MRPSFSPRTVNGPFDDPGVFVPFLFEKQALLFDLGENSALSSRDILRIDPIFVSHTHMDHFIGFDRVLRLCLGRPKRLRLYGPPGFLENLAGKLAGYRWNLTDNYEASLALEAIEVHADGLFCQTFQCRHRFIPQSPPHQTDFDGTLLETPGFTVTAALLDHGIPCLGFRLKERFHVNILKENLAPLGLAVGPWLKAFKNALFEGQDLESQFEIPGPDGTTRAFTLGELADRIAMISAGQTVAYITDVAFSRENRQKIVDLAQDADQLFIEAPFLEKDRQLAAEKYHLTAHQAGLLAGQARAKRFTVFHFSPRYSEMGDQLEAEARAAYAQAADGL